MSLRDVERAMIVFEYFYDKMEIFELKINEKAEKHDLEMEDIEQVCLTISFSLLICSLIAKAFLPFILRNPHLGSPSLIPSLAHFSWLSVSATMPDCRTERTMKRECLHSLWLL